MHGISPIVATVILIAIAVITAGMIFTWQAGWLSGWIAEMRESSARQLHCRDASIMLENFSYNCSNRCDPNVLHTLRGKIVNTGQVSLQLRALQLINTTGSVFEYPINANLPVDATISFTNTSLDACFGINQSVNLVTLVSNCGLITSGVLINWIDC